MKKILFVLFSFIFFGFSNIGKNQERNFLDAPDLLSPPNSAMCVSITPTLDWSDVIGVSQYRIQVSTTPAFSTFIVNNILTPSQYTITSPLYNNTSYYWHVKSINLPLDSSGWSDTWSFTTSSQVPSAPYLISPPNGQTNMPLTPTLYWSSISGATYKIQISRSSSFTITVFDTITAQNSVLVPSGKLLPGWVCYWRVAGINSCNGIGTWSSVWSFVTDPTEIKTYSSEIPTEYKLHNNFPNPFNPTTKIRFDLPKSTNIKLTVYNITGKEIEILADEKVSPGTYETEFNGENYPSGIYFYRLETTDFVQTNKMILLK